MTGPLKLFVIAGEPSGDRLGADLMRGLSAEVPGGIDWHGLGGPQMQAKGLNSLFPIDELAIMGLAEVVPRIPSLLARIRQTADAVADASPAALITIDSPDFCLRVARKVRAVRPGIRTIHYVAPSVWAWRPGRATKMARVIDHVLALLPFEPPYMQAAGMTCDFVGHPVAAAALPDAQGLRALRTHCSLPEGAPVLCLLPGSRAGEVGRHGPIFRAVAERLLNRNQALRIVIPTVGARRDQVQALFEGSRAQPLILAPGDLGPLDPETAKLGLFALSDAALAVSGTVSVELAAAGCPMVVAYKANALTTALARRLVKVDHASLVNILLDRAVIPEFLADAATPEALEAAVADLLLNPQQAAEQRRGFHEAMALLGRGGMQPGQRAARSVLTAIG